MGNGHLTGKDHTGSVNACQAMHIGDFGRREVYQSIEWKIFKEILSKHMGRRLI
jgi:hypothetical protein